MDQGPRKQHYAFAHKLFRPLMCGRASRFDKYAALARDGGDDPGIANMWASAAQNTGEPPIAELPSLRAIDGGFVVKMPQAIGIGEAMFIAVIRAPSGIIRYFTLEHSSFGTARFCEWRDDAHVNYGEIPPNPQAFFAGVRAKLQEA